MRDFEVPRGCDTLPGEVKEELWARKVDKRTRGKSDSRIQIRSAESWGWREA